MSGGSVPCHGFAKNDTLTLLDGEYLKNLGKRKTFLKLEIKFSRT